MYPPQHSSQLLQHVLIKVGWARSAVCEKTLNDLIAPLERDQRERIRDGANDPYLPPTIPPENMKEIVTSMDEALTASGTAEEKTVYTAPRTELIVACRDHCWTNVDDNGTVEESRWENGEVQLWKYDCRKQGLFICPCPQVVCLSRYRRSIVRLPLGIAYEGLEQFNAALEHYLHASDFIQATQPQILHYSVQYWISKILYRLCMLSLRLQDPTGSLKHFLRTKLSTHERLMVCYWYWRTLSGIVRKRVEQDTANHTTSNGDKRDAFHGLNEKRILESRLTFYELKDELLEAQNQYESVLMDYTQFPRAGRAYWSL